MKNLVQAVKNLQESLLLGQPLTETAKAQALQTIRSSFNSDHPYLGFIIKDLDRKNGLRMISGEKLHTRIGSFNVIGLEAARLLLLFKDPKAKEDILPLFEQRVKTTCFAGSCTQGECAHATAALWRYQAAGGLLQNQQNLEQQLLKIQKQRETFGSWNGYPFYYTLLALLELNNPLAAAEIEAVKESCFRRLKRGKAQKDPDLPLRLIILEKALEKAAI